MCGIAGVWRFRESANDRQTLTAVDAMIDALGHRGPDGRGRASGSSESDRGDVSAPVFGHTRLAVIDLSDRAAQPMWTPDRSLLVSFNGEIFNHAALRATLSARGRSFQTTSDTEVLLQAYAEWGSAMVEHLRGMFAFALWDQRAQSLLLVRDRLGIKPLYIHRSREAIVFASEIRALLRSGLIAPRLDPVALDQYLTYQTVPTPRTLVAGVEMLPPATIATVSAAGEWQTRTYWSPMDGVRADGTTRDAAREDLGRLLEDAVSSHLVSDVPVGVFLSGGIDSSVIAALVRRGGHAPRTFSVVFPGMPQDESEHARAVAQACEADHSELHVDRRDIPIHVAEALAAIDHPSGDGINTYLVSRAVRGAGIKVALSGLGGDELFGGYPSFARLRRLGRVRAGWSRTPRAVRNVAAAAVRTFGPRSARTLKAAALVETDASLAQALPVTRQLFSRQQRRALLRPAIWEAARQVSDPYVEFVRDLVARHPHHGVSALVSGAELHTYLHDVLLRDTDQMSMHHGLEVRVPLLDHSLVERALGLPDALFAESTSPKALLLESVPAVVAMLPSASLARPKQGFVLPFDAWMTTEAELGALCTTHLGTHGLAGRGLLNPLALRDLWLDFQSPRSVTTWSRPWALVALDAWLASTGVAL